MRLSGCLALGFWHTENPLRDDPVAHIDQPCAGRARQANSVAGVSQRCGVTIYSIAMARTDGRMPVFSLMR